MTNRTKKITEFMEGFRSLKRSLAFKPPELINMPRVTPSQVGVLMVLDGDGGYTVKDIAKALHISSSASTQLIDGLVANGYVLRKESAEDRRKVTLELSLKTKKGLEKMKAGMAKQFLDFFDVLNDEEFNQLMTLHKKIFERHAINKNNL